MGIKVSKPTPVFVDTTSVVLNVTNTGSNLNKKTVALRYYCFRENVANNVVEVRETHNSNNVIGPFIKPLARNDLHGFYHVFMVNG